MDFPVKEYRKDAENWLRWVVEGPGGAVELEIVICDEREIASIGIHARDGDTPCDLIGKCTPDVTWLRAQELWENCRGNDKIIYAELREWYESRLL